MEIMARFCTVRFLSAVRAVAARCKRPFALLPCLSQDGVMGNCRLGWRSQVGFVFVMEHIYSQGGDARDSCRLGMG